MTRDEHIAKLRMYIAQFTNGEKRYQESALVHRAVEVLVREGDPYQIIDQLIQIIDDNAKYMEELININMKPLLIQIDKTALDTKGLEIRHHGYGMYQLRQRGEFIYEGEEKDCLKEAYRIIQIDKQ